MVWASMLEELKAEGKTDEEIAEHARVFGFFADLRVELGQEILKSEGK